MWSAASPILLQDQIHEEEESNTRNTGYAGNADCERAYRNTDAGERTSEIDDRQCTEASQNSPDRMSHRML